MARCRADSSRRTAVSRARRSRASRRRASNDTNPAARSRSRARSARGAAAPATDVGDRGQEPFDLGSEKGAGRGRPERLARDGLGGQPEGGESGRHGDDAVEGPGEEQRPLPERGARGLGAELFREESVALLLEQTLEERAVIDGKRRI